MNKAQKAAQVKHQLEKIAIDIVQLGDLLEELIADEGNSILDLMQVPINEEIVAQEIVAQEIVAQEEVPSGPHPILQEVFTYSQLGKKFTLEQGLFQQLKFLDARHPDWYPVSTRRLAAQARKYKVPLPVLIDAIRSHPELYAGFKRHNAPGV